MKEGYHCECKDCAKVNSKLRSMDDLNTNLEAATQIAIATPSEDVWRPTDECKLSEGSSLLTKEE